MYVCVSSAAKFKLSWTKFTLIYIFSWLPYTNRACYFLMFLPFICWSSWIYQLLIIFQILVVCILHFAQAKFLTWLLKLPFCGTVSCYTGYSLFLALVIDRLHYYLRKLSNLKKKAGVSNEEVEKIKKEHLHWKENEEKASVEIKKMQEEIATLTEKLQKTKSEFQEQEKRATSAEAHVVALQKQSEELLLEYDRLLEDNQVLQAQALSYRG